MNAVTVDDIQRVARLYLKPDRLSVVLVGNAAAFADQLQGVGFGSFETVEIGSLDLTAVDFKSAGRRQRSLTPRVLLSCGEPSGDLYAGALTRELRALAPGAEVFGLGGPAFAAAGGRAVADYRGLSVTGLTEPIAKIPAVHGRAPQPAGRRARDPARRVRAHRLLGIQPQAGANASAGRASPSRTTSARSCGRRGRGA